MANKIVNLTLVADYTPPPDPPEANAQLNLEFASYSVNENEWLTFRIHRTIRTDQVLTVDWAFTNVSMGVLSGTATFNLGVDYVTIQVLANEVDTDELGSLDLSNPLYVSGPFSEPIIGSQGSASVSLFNTDAPEGVDDQTLRDIGYILVTDSPYNAVGDGVTDDTAAIQAALLDASNDSSVGKPVYFPPNKTYLISDTLRFNQYSQFDPITLHGGSYGQRPIIKLANGATNFQNENDPRPMMVMRAHHYVSWPNYPSDPLSNTAPYNTITGNLFRASVMNLHFDCGNNPGAFGWYGPAAQNCFFANLSCDASNALGGFWGLGGANSPAVNIEVTGGRWGYYDKPINAGESPSGSCIVGLKIVGDSRMDKAIKFNGFCPLTIVGFDITYPNAGAAIQNESSPYNTSSNGIFTLIDGVFQLASNGYAMNNTLSHSASGRRSQYMRNVYVTGTNNLVQSGDEPMVTGSGTWKRINEYSYCNQISRDSARGWYENWNIIDGVVNRTPEPLTSISNSVSSPPDFIARHTMDFPMPDSGPFVNIEDHGAVGVFNWSTGGSLFSQGQDNTSAIQAAITAAKNAGHNRVVIPRKSYGIGSTVQLDKDTILIGVGMARSWLYPRVGWNPTSNVYCIQTADDATGTCHVGHIGCHVPQKRGTLLSPDGPYSNSWFSWVNWRTGRYSSSVLPWCPREYILETSYILGRRFYHFEGNAGGKHYSVTNHAGLATGAWDDGFRQILIEGTTAPLHLYGVATESYKKGSPPMPYNTEIRNSQNVRLYSSKREGDAPTVRIFNSQNIAYYGLGRQAFEDDSNYHPIDAICIVDGTSDNVVIAPIQRDYQNEINDASRTFLYENVGFGVVECPDWPQQVAVYKRGELDDNAMVI